MSTPKTQESIGDTRKMFGRKRQKSFRLRRKALRWKSKQQTIRVRRHTYWASESYKRWVSASEIVRKIWDTGNWSEDGKRSVYNPIPKKGDPSTCEHNRTIALISLPSKVLLKIIQYRLQQHTQKGNSSGFRKCRETQDHIESLRWLMEESKEYSNGVLYAFSTTGKPLTVSTTRSCGCLWGKWDSSIHYLASEISTAAKKQRCEQNMAIRNILELTKASDKNVRCHSTCST